MFRKGTYKFNDDPNFNFQLNRVIMWGNGDPEEIKSVSKNIVDSASWVKELQKLSEKAEKEGRIDAHIGYLRMSEFFMYDSDPQKLETYTKAKNLFYTHNENKLKEKGIENVKVSYEDGFLPVMVGKADGNCQGRILLHGGNDSYIEEFFEALCYFKEKGFDVYLFEGPGQGGVLREQNLKFDSAWEKPVTAIIDHFKLEDVTIIGASLGGYLAPRAAAFEKRITKVVAWSIFPDFFDILLADDPVWLRVVMDFMYKVGLAGIFNILYKKMMEQSELIKWNLMHGMYAYNAPDPVGYVKKIREFTLKGIGDKINQDMLIIGGKDDHMIMTHLIHEEIDLLPNVRSLAFQLYSNQDDAGSHCNIGNMKLILDTMISWIQQMNSKNEHLKSQ
ncbi:alpha/beta-hydrolase [Neocallimastix lanati (nom. inval.)]|uniref:Alpha/beta-hydrolase n=1 Tax=Neocallimastix californiae TaxID=1754190 RepID=A0A1Y2CC20_9FUNG|nr:alpha/beta-hydrolase [Neocallimastix sp. JGI-2020a]ORY44583.1 alpha/beta-hydrolase [Neocallimastix californiae]|eukprot:ORY44583.1 alpha/beta-hydrolase [Neocallimastix californiae]